MRILFAGGGTLGSVTPLLALIPTLLDHKHEILFVGTARGPEGAMIRARNIPFRHIVAPKLRRYISWRYILIPFELCIGIVQSARCLWRWKPDVIVTAGGYVAVPLGWIGWVLRIPLVVHQQDVRPGIANIYLQKMASVITVVFKESLVFFQRSKTQWVGNPVRDMNPTTHVFRLDANVPTVLIMGGGTGAQAINDYVSEDLCSFANVIHITGRGKSGPRITNPRYHELAFADEEMNEAYHCADVVVSRAGLGVITELAALGKPAILIPMPDTHQEENAKLIQRYNACVVCDQKLLNSRTFIAAVFELVRAPRRREVLSRNIKTLMPPHAIERMVAIIEAL